MQMCKNLDIQIHVSRKQRGNIFHQGIRSYKQPHHKKRIRHDKNKGGKRTRGKLTIINDANCDPNHCAYPVQVSKKVEPPRKRLNLFFHVKYLSITEICGASFVLRLIFDARPRRRQHIFIIGRIVEFIVL